MLIGQDGGAPDQNEPKDRGMAKVAAGRSRITLRQDRAKRDVERREQVMGLIESPEPSEEHAQRSAGFRPLKSEAKGKEEKAHPGNEDGSDDSFGKRRQFSIGATK